MRKTAEQIRDPWLMGYDGEQKVALYYGDIPYQALASRKPNTQIYKWEWHNGDCITVDDEIVCGSMSFDSYTIHFANQCGYYGITIYKTFKGKTYTRGFRNSGATKFIATCDEEMEQDEIIKVLNHTTDDDGYIIKKFLNACKECYENDSKMCWD